MKLNKRGTLDHIILNQNNQRKQASQGVAVDTNVQKLFFKQLENFFGKNINQNQNQNQNGNKNLKQQQKKNDGKN